MENIFKCLVGLLLFINLLGITGCKQIKRKIEYKYGTLTVTRVDDASASNFWLGTINSVTDQKPNFRIVYTGLNGGYRAYLIFEHNHVELFSEFGNVDVIRNSSLFFITQRFDSANEGFNNINFIHWRDSISQNFKNIRIIQAPSFKDEVMTNKENRTLVKAIVQDTRSLFDY